MYLELRLGLRDDWIGRYVVWVVGRDSWINGIMQYGGRGSSLEKLSEIEIVEQVQ